MAILGQEVVDTIHPKYWPYGQAEYNEVKYWYAQTSKSSHASPFYDYLVGTFGAFNTTASKTADTYYTYADITGHHGAMGTIIFPDTTGADQTGFYTVKLTTDGVVEEFRTISASLTSDDRRFIGFATEFADGNYAFYARNSGYGMYPFYAEYSGIDSYAGSATVRSVQDSMHYGCPVHQFKESLKVEVKCSLVGHGDEFRRNGIVFYTSAPNL